MNDTKFIYLVFLLYLLTSLWKVECRLCDYTCGSNSCLVVNNPSQCSICFSSAGLAYAVATPTPTPTPCPFNLTDPFTSTIALLIDINPTTVVGTSVLKNYTKNSIVRSISG